MCDENTIKIHEKKYEIKKYNMKNIVKMKRKCIKECYEENSRENYKENRHFHRFR